MAYVSRHLTSSSVEVSRLSRIVKLIPTYTWWYDA